jgi:hypothetical protein
MDSGEILYNFSLNNTSLGDIHKHANDIANIQGEITNLFDNTLGQWYTGAGKDGLMAAKQNILNMLQEANDRTISTQQLAMEQQESMNALDRMHAADFGG